MEYIQKLLLDIQENGEWKEPAREGMPRTKSVFSRELRFNLQEGFPVVTTKELYWKGVVVELLWFLRGSTNIKYLVDNGVGIWNDDAYKYYKKQFQELYPNSLQNLFTKEEFVARIKEAPNLESLENIHVNGYLGDCGKIYGHQWIAWSYPEFEFDQINNLVENIKKNPNNRYHIVTAWNPTDFIQFPENAALPACHMMFQVYIRQGKYLDLKMIQRSCDTFLGVPFNVASYSLLTHILADLTGYEAGEFIWSGNDIHYYENQEDAVMEILKREPYKLPTYAVSSDYFDILSKYKKNEMSVDEFISLLEPKHFILVDYEHHPKLKAPLSVGI